jgi:23S rRNA (cytidine1920-2'-O)/16S rRNA (cytidine1409-2'-O)-methyltransferase
MARQRIDALLAERGLAPSRTSAAESVRAGRVRLGHDGPLASKPSQLVADDADLLLTESPPFVSRGGIKLANALDALGLDVTGFDCLDVGASTGGFTDCLLQHGAARVIALDVAHGQLDWGIRNDPRVTVVERRNARLLEQSELPFRPRLATIDVSFISLTKVVPPVVSCLTADGELLAMVKPQFEMGRGRVRGGVVRDPAERREALRAVADAVTEAGLGVLGFAGSGLPGPKGNRETFVHAAVGGDSIADVEAAIAAVEP